jgi:hypothetical protein
MAKFTGNGAAELYYDNVKKFETIGAGATVTGTLYATSVSAATVTTTGNVTARAFIGDASQLTNLPSSFSVLDAYLFS